MMCKHLLRKGADPNVTNKANQTPLHIAIDSGYMDIATQLFNYGAKNEVLDKNGKTPLDLASKIDKIKLERSFYSYRTSRSLSRQTRVRSNQRLMDWDISSIKNNAKPFNFDSKMNSPNNLNSLNFLFSTYQSNNNNSDCNKMESTPEDRDKNFKRQNRKEYQTSFVKAKMHEK